MMKTIQFQYLFITLRRDETYQEQIDSTMNWMDHNIKILLWSMTGDDESECDGLEWNLLQI